MTNEITPQEEMEAAVSGSSWFWSSFYTLRNRVIAGFFVALPIIVTFIVIRWLYNFVARDIIASLATWLIKLVRPTIEEAQIEIPPAIDYVLAPAIAVIVILAALFMLGMLIQSRTLKLVDWVMTSVPGVGIIYSSVRNAIESVRKTSNQKQQFKRVVLVKFPHPGMKVPAFVTSSTTDASTGETILCVYVPTTPIPTSGYMLMIPESEVTEISWDLSETLQAIVSGGMTVPEKVEYYDSKTIDAVSKTDDQDESTKD